MGRIYNFNQVDTQLACSGQPTEEQLGQIAEEGYKVIINLALTGSKYSLPDEAASVTGLGLTYHHIPVQFDNPRLQELKDFFDLMNRHQDAKVLVHCAANYRASCFTGLYLLAIRRFDRDAMDDFIATIWQPDAIWQQFVAESVDYLNL